jgi:hypothetical protein
MIQFNKKNILKINFSTNLSLTHFLIRLLTKEELAHKPSLARSPCPPSLRQLLVSSSRVPIHNSGWNQNMERDSQFWLEPKYGERKRNRKRFHRGKIHTVNCYEVRKVIV